ncbi:MAG: hypothetical protein WDN50_19330 [Bradyrhizobium sp.]
MLLFAVDAYLPKLPAADNAHTAANAASDISVIRIHSVQKWPARVEFDTSLPTIMPAAPVLAANNVPADATAPARMREAFAQLQTTQVQTTQVQTSELQTAEPKKPELKLPPKRRVVASRTVTGRTMAKNQIGPPMMLVAQQPRLGLFPNTIW